MNELQLALIGAGVFAIAAVWIYNLLDERKHRKAAEAVFKGQQDDVLLEGRRTAKPAVSPAVSTVAPPADVRSEPDVRREPVMAPVEPDAFVATAAPEAEPFTPQEPSRSPAQPTPDAVEPMTDAPGGSTTRHETGPDELLPWADPLTDCLVAFTTPTAVPAAALWAAHSNWSSAIGKPVYWLARVNAGSPWAAVSGTTAERFSDWLVALQLVDRAGPVSDAGLARFVDGMQQIGRQTGSQINPPLRSEMLLRAQELDRFCASVDVQFSLSVVSAQGNAFVGTKLRGVCEAAGLSLDADGLYRYRNASGENEFSLGNLGNEAFDPAAMSSLATHGVSLTIDVPRVADGSAAFNRMVLVARQLAQGLGGTLVDAHRVVLSDVVISTIRSKIIELQQVLNTAGIVPGGARALRLFS